MQHSPPDATEHVCGDRTPLARGIIEVRLQEMGQLFDVLDPSPFRDKALDRRAEEYIVERKVLRRELRQLLRRSLISFGIGSPFWLRSCLSHSSLVDCLARATGSKLERSNCTGQVGRRSRTRADGRSIAPGTTIMTRGQMRSSLKSNIFGAGSRRSATRHQRICKGGARLTAAVRHYGVW